MVVAPELPVAGQVPVTVLQPRCAGAAVTLLALWGCLGWTLVLVASDHGCRALDGPSLLLLRNWRLATVWGAGAAHA